MLFFVDDPEGAGYNEYKTEEEARMVAEGLLATYEESAAEDGEWNGYLDSLRWGKVYQKGKEVPETSPEGVYYVGKLLDV